MAASKVSIAKFNQVRKRLENMNKQRMKIKSVADDKVQNLVRSCVVGGAGMSLGVIRGKFGKLDISGMPVELLAAAVFHGAGLMGVGNDMATHLHSFGDGCLAVALADIGEKVGKGKLGEYIPGKSIGPTSSGYQLEGARLSDEELEALAR